MWCVAGIFAAIVSVIWGYSIVQGERENDRRQHFGSRDLSMIFLDFEYGHVRV